MSSSTLRAQADALIAEISRAFWKVKRAGGMTLQEAWAIDAYQPPKVARAARRTDRELHWRDIPDTKLEQFATGMSFMDAPGFRFHLPAFMIYALKHYEDTFPSFYAGDVAIDALDPGRWRANELYGPLTAAERCAVRHFLRFFATPPFKDQDAQSALDRYWEDTGAEKG